jgi:hypothetical protein
MRYVAVQENYYVMHSSTSTLHNRHLQCLSFSQTRMYPLLLGIKPAPSKNAITSTSN